MVVRRVLPVAILLGALAAAAPASTRPVGRAAAAAGNPFVGVVSEDAFARPGSYRRATFSRQRAAGVGTVRQTLHWANVERAPGRYDFNSFDGFVGDAARAGIRILPILFDPPAFRSSRPSRHALRGTYPPRDDAAFAAFAAAAVRRYGPSGSYWSEHPEIPPLPIRDWQVWNEPNLPVYWRPRPDAGAYVALLRAASNAIKAIDPGADVVTAGLPQSRLRGAVALRTWVSRMYSAGAADAFDTLALNPYSPTAGGVLTFLRRIRALMNGRGDSAASLWATEFGWSDRGPGSKFRLGPSGQARQVGATLRLLWAKRRPLNLRGVVYYAWRDAHVYAGGHDFWGLHTGLLNLRGHRKPAYAAFRRAARSLG
jgi:hypothetical protein